MTKNKRKQPDQLRSETNAATYFEWSVNDNNSFVDNFTLANFHRQWHFAGQIHKYEGKFPSA